MLREICKRILSIIPVLLIVITLAFCLTKFIPGGPFDDEKTLDKDIKLQIEKTYGLHEPLISQYVKYITNVAHFNFGPSMKYSGWEVKELIQSKALVSLELASYSILIAIIVGLTLGTLCAKFHNSFFGNFLSGLSIFGICVPTFVSGPILSYFFGYKLHLFPIAGWGSVATKILPSMALGLFFASYIAKLTHVGTLNTLSQDYITFARSKGLSKKRVFFAHVLPNSMVSVVAFLGPTFAAMLSGSIVIETVFRIPGMGQLFIESINNRDVTLIVGIVVFYATLVSIFNILTDIFAIILFPKQRSLS